MRASDVFDVLVSCADFETFKDLMLSHKSLREVRDSFFGCTSGCTSGCLSCVSLD